MILLVGAGPMAIDYAKVLKAQNAAFTVVGRSAESAALFTEKTGLPVITGGLSAFLANNKQSFSAAIVSVGVEALASSTLQLINHGIKRLLVEKPAGLNMEEIVSVDAATKKHGAQVFVAYNRRFYSSVIAAKAIIAADGGVASFNFEVTEWAHVIANIPKADGVKEHWFLGNTSHVADLAFYLGGQPEEMCTFSSGSTSWHSRSANFAGAGRSSNGALFSYHGNWNAPGRWSVEILTRNHRLIFRPMEKLQIQKTGSVAIENQAIDDHLDTEFKPGLYLQINAFLASNTEDRAGNLCSIGEHLQNCKTYMKMANYQ